MDADGLDGVPMTPSDPYEPPRARELAVPPLPPDLGRRGAAWFGLPALAGMLILQVWDAYTGRYDTFGQFVEPAVVLGVLVVLCGAIGKAIGSRCLDSGWSRFLAMSAGFGVLWAVGAGIILTAYAGYSAQLGSLSHLLYFSRATPLLALFLVPLTLLLAAALRAWALRHP